MSPSLGTHCQPSGCDIERAIESQMPDGRPRAANCKLLLETLKRLAIAVRNYDAGDVAKACPDAPMWMQSSDNSHVITRNPKAAFVGSPIIADIGADLPSSDFCGIGQHGLVVPKLECTDRVIGFIYKETVRTIEIDHTKPQCAVSAEG